MQATWLKTQLIQGHGVASGRSENSPYPAGTIAMQRPLFHDLGLDLSDCYAGTLNLSFAPLEVQLRDPDHTFAQLCWTDRHPPETFSFWRIEVRCSTAQATPAWIYHPHPETKQRHWQAPTTVEVLAPRLDGLLVGATVELLDTHQRIRLVDGVRLRARLLEFLKFRVLASQDGFFKHESMGDRRLWLSSLFPEAGQLSDSDLERVWRQARMLYTED